MLFRINGFHIFIHKRTKLTSNDTIIKRSFKLPRRFSVYVNRCFLNQVKVSVGPLLVYFTNIFRTRSNIKLFKWRLYLYHLNIIGLFCFDISSIPSIFRLNLLLVLPQRKLVSYVISNLYNLYLYSYIL